MGQSLTFPSPSGTDSVKVEQGRLDSNQTGWLSGLGRTGPGEVETWGLVLPGFAEKSFGHKGFPCTLGKRIPWLFQGSQVLLGLGGAPSTS